MRLKNQKAACVALSLCMMMTMAGCGGSSSTSTSTATSTASSAASTAASSEAESVASSTEAAASETASTPAEKPADAAVTDLDFNSDVTALEGDWKLVKVYTADGEADAAADAMTLSISLELDPSELVDGTAYIHNQVYNLSSNLSFGLQEINDALAAEDIESYKGSTSWEDFTKGEVVEDGQFYKQPGPATMRFKDIDVTGLFLDQIAGVSSDIDTTEKKLIIGLNYDGQLLLGYSEEHLEREGTDGDWVYCLVFEK